MGYLDDIRNAKRLIMREYVVNSMLVITLRALCKNSIWVLHVNMLKMNEHTYIVFRNRFLSDNCNYLSNITLIIFFIAKRTTYRAFYLFNPKENINEFFLYIILHLWWAGIFYTVCHSPLWLGISRNDALLFSIKYFTANYSDLRTWSLQHKLNGTICAPWRRHLWGAVVFFNFIARYIMTKKN